MNLTLVDGLVVVWAHELVNEKEVISILRSKFTANVKVCFFVVGSLLLIGDDFDITTFSSSALVAFNALFKCLISGSHNLVNSELNLPY